MMILFYGLLSFVSLALGLYARSASPSARQRKWLGRRESWFGNVFSAVAWAGMAGEECVKAARPRFYSAHDTALFGAWVAAVVLAGAVWIAWNVRHSKGAA